MDKQEDHKETANTAPPVQQETTVTGRKVTEPEMQNLPHPETVEEICASVTATETEVYNQLLQHNQEVQKFMCWVAGELAVRGTEHDRSKFDDEEFNTFVKFAPMLKTTTYGDEEYKAALEEMKPALEHHYKANRHHPEHFCGGIQGMNLIDLVEMFCDWYASTKRQKDGDIRKSIEGNQKRFGFSDELKQILLNTVEWDERG